MKYLLDTHAWIWWNMVPLKLSKRVKSAIENTDGYSELPCQKYLVNIGDWALGMGGLGVWECGCVGWLRDGSHS